MPSPRARGQSSVQIGAIALSDVAVDLSPLWLFVLGRSAGRYQYLRSGDKRFSLDRDVADGLSVRWTVSFG